MRISEEETRVMAAASADARRIGASLKLLNDEIREGLGSGETNGITIDRMHDDGLIAFLCAAFVKKYRTGKYKEEKSSIEVWRNVIKTFENEYATMEGDVIYEHLPWGVFGSVLKYSLAEFQEYIRKYKDTSKGRQLGFTESNQETVKGLVERAKDRLFKRTDSTILYNVSLSIKNFVYILMVYQIGYELIGLDKNSPWLKYIENIFLSSKSLQKYPILSLEGRAMRALSTSGSVDPIWAI